MDPEESDVALPSVVQLPKIPSPPELPLRERLPVFVTHYERPSKLFLRCDLSGQRNECIEEDRDYHIEEDRRHLYEVAIGMHCMVLPERSSRRALRALVTDVRRDANGFQLGADVMYVDEGRTDVVGIENVFPINNFEARDPQRSVACCMRGIRPTWESSCYDLDHLHDDNVPCYYDAIFYGLSDGGIYEVDLFLNFPETPTEPQRYNVAELLVDNGCAELLDHFGGASPDGVETMSDASDHSQCKSEVSNEQSLSDTESIHSESTVTAERELCPDDEVCAEREVSAENGITNTTTEINHQVADRSPSTLSACSVDSLSDDALIPESLAPLLPKGTTINITVTFIVSPHHWYGLPASALEKLSEVSSIIESCEKVLCGKQQIRKGAYLLYRDLPLESGTRVCVEELLSAGLCRVFLLDYGSRKVVKLSCLFKLDRRLHAIAPLALRFELADIQPWTQWTETTTAQFEKLVRTDFSLTAVIVGTSSSGDVFDDTVYLASLLSETYGDVAAFMRLEGYARMPTVKFKRYTQNTNSAALEPFNPMQDDYNNPLNSYAVNTDDPGVAASNFSVRTERICKFFSSQGYCRQGECCVFKHIDAEANSAILHVTEPVTAYVELNPPQSGSLLLGQMSAYALPRHFYLIFCYGRKTISRLTVDDETTSTEETLQDLMDGMQVFYSRGRFLENRLFEKSVGEPVAARSSIDNVWYRAKVVSLGSGDQLKVFYVDFGFSEWLSLNDIRALDPRFTHLPIQSQLCTLVDSDLRGMRDETGWNEEMCRKFIQCVTGEILLVETVCFKEGLLHVKLFLYRGDRMCSVTDFINDL